MDHSRSDAIHAHMCALEAMKLYNSKELNWACPDLVNPYFVKNFTIGGRSSGKTQFRNMYRDALIELNSLERRTNMNFKKLYGGPMFLEYNTIFEASDILNKILRTFKKAGVLYVGDLCELVYANEPQCDDETLDIDAADWAHGWRSLNNISISAGIRKWRITFPDVVCLDRKVTANMMQCNGGILYSGEGRLPIILPSGVGVEVVHISTLDNGHECLTKKMNVPAPEKKILSLLDIEELSASGEEFQLKRDGMWTRYKIKDQNFMYYNILDDDFRKTARPLSEILNLEFRRLPEKPWKPSRGEEYWWVYISYDGIIHTISTEFDGCSHDMERFISGNFFKTETEAKKHRVKFDLAYRKACNEYLSK